MRNKTQINKTCKKLNDDVKFELKDVQALYDLIKKSDDKETDLDYKEHMIRAKWALKSKDQYTALFEINQALIRVKVFSYFD